MGERVSPRAGGEGVQADPHTPCLAPLSEASPSEGERGRLSALPEPSVELRSPFT